MADPQPMRATPEDWQALLRAAGLVKDAPARIDGKPVQSLADMARESGFSAADGAELAPVLRIDGREYR